MTETIYFIVAAILFYILGPLTALHAIMNSPSSQGAIAWGMALISFPYLSVPLYWLFGRNKFNDYVTDRQEVDERIYGIGKDKAALLEGHIVDTTLFPNLHAAERLVRLPVLDGNTTELLIDGEATFDNIEKGLLSAHSYILLQFYIVNDDVLGRRLQKVLIQKAQEGVRVYFLYDKVGSQQMTKKYLKEMRDVGVLCYDFNAKKGPQNRFRVNFRNHRKIVVVDGEQGWVGGHNVGDEYLGKGKLGNWRDTHMKVSGPAVQVCQLSFLEDWHWATETILDVQWDPKPHTDNTPVLILPTGPSDAMDSASLMYTHAISTAKERIWIASPYFVPDDAVITALQLAGLRGVDVRIVVPDNPDQMLVYLAAYSFFKDASETGAKFYRYTKGFMHQKTMLIDDTISGIGTANMDNRSFRLNFEITSFVIDRGFALQVEKMFEEDFSNSRFMAKEEMDGHSFWFQLKVQVARLFSPLL